MKHSFRTNNYKTTHEENKLIVECKQQKMWIEVGAAVAGAATALTICNYFHSLCDHPPSSIPSFIIRHSSIITLFDKSFYSCTDRPSRGGIKAYTFAASLFEL